MLEIASVLVMVWIADAIHQRRVRRQIRYEGWEK
jgi:hypothetical protein